MSCLETKITYGTRYGQLTIVAETYSTFTMLRGTIKRFICRCDCGKKIVAELYALEGNLKMNCGCTHNQFDREETLCHRSPTYRYWARLKREKQDKVCDNWLKSFTNFLMDMGDKPNEKILKRYNEDKNYFLENCYWGDKWER